MRVFSRISLATVCMLCGPFLCVTGAKGFDTQSEVLSREAAGDLTGARQLLEQQQSDGSGAHAFAEFLDRHHDPGTRQAYLKWISAESDSTQRRIALRQLVLNDYLAGDSGALATDLAQYHAAGGSDLVDPPKPAALPAKSFVSIPGPLPAFARMAALSPDLAPDELLPALARNVVTNGYEASGNESLQQTEFLRLVVRYLAQARELQAMAGKDRKIVVPTCDSEETNTLLKALGYRMRGSCGGDIVLETVNPTRAFLTVDSGFPLANLEAELRANHRFELQYAPTQVPVLYTSDYWMQALTRNNQGEFIDAFIGDPSLCRLYLGLSHVNRATAEALRKQATAVRLKAYANVLDFYGAMFDVKENAAVVPGNARSWASLVGAPPSNGGAFFDKLLASDDGWGASYFDALSRVDPAIASYLTQPERLKRFYDALRGKVTSPGPARPVFRSSTELMLLTASLRLEPNGQVHLPGNVEVWKTLFVKHPHGKYDAKLTRAAGNWRATDDVLEALFALSRKTVENEPLRIFLALNDIDRKRSRPLSPELVARLIGTHRIYGPQYNLLTDAPGLSEATINRYLDDCADITATHDGLLRSDVAGVFQASVELWRILVVRGLIPLDAQDAAFNKVVAPYGHIRQHSELFDAGRASVDALLSSAGANVSSSSARQDRMVELLAGKLRNGDETPASPANMFLRVYDSQRLLSLDTLFAMGSVKGSPDAKLLKTFNEQMDRITEIDGARNTLSTEERNAFSAGYWSSRHIDAERKFNLDKALKNADRKDLREGLAPFLRDSMVGLLYSYYAPAGAQLLLTNPSFVRNHDFIGPENAPSTWRNTDVSGSGWPASSGGRLIGSLASIPYALAEAEQNFLTPRREQALIWADLVPQMIANVTISRWSAARPEQLRWVALHIARGRNLVIASALDPALETRVLDSYARWTTPAKVEWLKDHLHSAPVAEVVAEVPPSCLYAIASDPAIQSAPADTASEQIAALRAANLPSLSPAAIGHVFGSPKPTLTHSYQPGLLNLRTFPALMGYSSRILAESWESNGLFYAALADELAVPVNRLDAYVPEWNRTAIEGIFATHLEDWPAILRSLHATAASVRSGKSSGPMAMSNSEN